MNDFRDRLKKLAKKIIMAQNVERGSYFESTYDTVGDPERSPMGGDYGGSPVGPSRPPIIYDNERLDRRKYPRFDFSLGVTSKDYDIQSADGIHFTAPSYGVEAGGDGAAVIPI